jgi:hypothetical protein
MLIYDVKFFPSIKINVIIVLCEYICDKSSTYQNACRSYSWNMETGNYLQTYCNLSVYYNRGILFLDFRYSIESSYNYNYPYNKHISRQHKRQNDKRTNKHLQNTTVFPHMFLKLDNEKLIWVRVMMFNATSVISWRSVL